MSDKHITPALLARTVHVIDSSGIVDQLWPRQRVGRRGAVRENGRLLLIGLSLCTRLGHETTVRGAHQVLTEALSREDQWELGVLRPISGAAPRDKKTGELRYVPLDPDAPTLVKNGKPRKRRWEERGVEELSYDDLHHAAVALRRRLDYGPGSAPDLGDEERAARRGVIEGVVDALITVTTIPRTGSTYAIDATGQWAWTRGPKRVKDALQQRADAAVERNDPAALDPSEADAAENGDLETGPIAFDDNGASAPRDQDAPVAAETRRRCLDAAWGYRTEKDGQKGPGFGFHQHTIVRVPDPGDDADGEPHLVDGFVITPANADVVEASLGLIDRIRARHAFTRLLGDLLYTNLRAGRWAMPLAQRGIEQVLAMRSDNHKLMDIDGAVLQHHWLHCPAAPMDQRPIPPERASEQEWEELHEKVEAFQRNWAFARKESGLGACRTSKWVCPALDGRAGCPARGDASVEAARRLGLPVVTPPADWQTRKCCTNRSLDFTPDPDDPNHQRKLAQREYYGSRRWRRLFKRRSLVEGVFGILKNPSRQRLRRGQNRLPGLAIATIIAAIKVSVFNEEQLRAWHARTGKGPAGHPLLQPDEAYHGFTHLTKDEAEAIDVEHLRRSGDGGGAEEAA